MSARDELEDLAWYKHHAGEPKAHRATVERILSMHAHELAEKILAVQTNWTGDGDIAKATRDALIVAAYLIDPEVKE